MVSQRRASIEAIGLLKDWSSTLAFIDTGLIAALGALIQSGPPAGGQRWLIASIALFVASLVLSLNVIGSLPDVAQRFGTEEEPCTNLYRVRNRLGIPLGLLAFLQHATLVAALAALIPLLLKWLSQNTAG